MRGFPRRGFRWRTGGFALLIAFGLVARSHAMLPGRLADSSPDSSMWSHLSGSTLAPAWLSVAWTLAVEAQDDGEAAGGDADRSVETPNEEADGPAVSPDGASDATSEAEASSEQPAEPRADSADDAVEANRAIEAIDGDPDEGANRADASNVSIAPNADESEANAVGDDSKQAADSEPPAVRLVRVPLPIAGVVDDQVRQLIEQLIAELPRDSAERPILVLEFRPVTDEAAAQSQFERCLALARFLTGPRLAQARLQTVAYIPGTLKGHAVLVALACEQIIMHPEAELGEAAIAEPAIDPTVLRGYREIAERRSVLPVPLVLGLVDPKLEVARVTTADGVQFVLADQLAEIQGQQVVHSVDTVIPAGQAGLVTGRQLRFDYHLIAHLADSRRELAAALGIGVDALEQDPSLGRGWRAVRVQLHGPVAPAVVGRVTRAIQEGIERQNANLVFLDIDSPGGHPVASLNLARYLIDLDDSKVRTVAYVRGEARGDAALVAWACNQLVMDGNATLGGPGAHEFSRQELEDVRVAVAALAAERERSWSVAVAMVDPNLEVNRYAFDGSTNSVLWSPEELSEQAESQRWVRRQTVHPSGDPWTIDAAQAQEIGLARFTVSRPEELATLYQLTDQPELIKSRWAYELIEALSRPEVAAALLFLGGFALIAELSSPGLGVGGFLASVCFLLYFWSNFLHGTAAWLEIILFLTGVAFVLLELFVLPGFGVFGLGGGAMILASLILASQTFVWPQNEYQLHQLPRSLAIVSSAVIGLAVSGYLMRRYLAQTRLLRGIALEAPAEGATEDVRGAYDHLVGEVGIAETPLRPAGKVRFGDKVVDVVSDGGMVTAGQPVRVESVLGNRVIVTPVE